MSILTDPTEGRLDVGPSTSPLRLRVEQADRDAISSKLRLSLVDTCNLACSFCHNEGQAPVSRPSKRVISVEDYVQIVRAAAQAGITNFKLTGGEPLLYRDSHGDGITALVGALSKVRTEESLDFSLSVTTNGIVLPALAPSLFDAGLDRATISLHTLQAAKFTSVIARSGSKIRPSRVVEGIAAAVAAGLAPVKVNVALFSDNELGGNVDEIASIYQECAALGVSEVRFYCLIRHENFVDHEARYQVIDSAVLRKIGLALSNDQELSTEYEEQASKFLANTRSVLYPRPRLIAGTGDGPSVSIEAIEAGQFEPLGITDEGPYALRLSSSGELRGLLTSEPCADLLADGAPASDLLALFRGARQSALPL